MAEAMKFFYDPDHRQRVLTAIIKKRLSGRFAFRLIQASAHQQFPSDPGTLTLGNPHARICHFGDQRRQNIFQRVRPGERRMVHVVFRN